MISRALPVVLAAVALLCGCDTYHYFAGMIHEDARRPVLALKQYEKFLASRPQDPRACEVRLRTAEIYRAIGRRLAVKIGESAKDMTAKFPNIVVSKNT